MPAESRAAADTSPGGAFDLGGSRAFVTGANTGIGQAIAIALADAGARVVAVGRSSMEETLRLIDGRGGEAVSVKADLGTRDGAVAAFEDAVATHGPIDILVNNAGIIRRADAVDFTEEDWDDVMDVNLKSAFFLSQAFARHRFAGGHADDGSPDGAMTGTPNGATTGATTGTSDGTSGGRGAGASDDASTDTTTGAAPGGSIVNVASLLSFQGGIRVSSYTASKSGITGLTRGLSNEWAARGITVNAVAPGYVATNNTEALRNDPERHRAILERIPAGRWATPADIAGAVVFLASPAARYVTGITLPVDGGWLGR